MQRNPGGKSILSEHRLFPWSRDNEVVFLASFIYSAIIVYVPENYKQQRLFQLQWQYKINAWATFLHLWNFACLDQFWACKARAKPSCNRVCMFSSWLFNFIQPKSLSFKEHDIPPMEWLSQDHYSPQSRGWFGRKSLPVLAHFSLFLAEGEV